MKFPLTIVVILILVAYVLMYESFDAARVGIGIRDMVDNNLSITQYRAKYGSAVSSLQVNYLADAYRKNIMTVEKIKEIMGR